MLPLGYWGSLQQWTTKLKTFYIDLNALYLALFALLTAQLMRPHVQPRSLFGRGRLIRTNHRLLSQIFLLWGCHGNPLTADHWPLGVSCSKVYGSSLGKVSDSKSATAVLCRPKQLIRYYAAMNVVKLTYHIFLIQNKIFADCFLEISA